MTCNESNVRTPVPSGVRHIRHRHESHFTVVGNHLAQHPTLSATAIGIAVRIQSLPDGAKVSIRALAEHFPEGEARIAAALRELEAAGYLARERERTSARRIVTRTTYFERPGQRVGRADRVDLADGAAPAREVKERPAPPCAAPVDDALARPVRELLAGLRSVDERLLLSAPDIDGLVPRVRVWLDRGVSYEQVRRTLAGSLPVGPVTCPAALLAYRLDAWVPPVDPVPPPPVRKPLPFQTCDGCERAFRAAGPGRCAECRSDTGREGSGAGLVGVIMEP